MQELIKEMNEASNSGASFQLRKTQNTVQVLKTMPNIDGRVLASLKKQESFVDFGAFTAVPIGHIQRKDDLITVSMDVARGLSIHRLVTELSKERARFMVDNFSNYFEILNNNSSQEVIAGEIFEEKIKSIINALSSVQYGELAHQARELLCEIQNSLSTDYRVPIGPCHGDFTFSNMIFDFENEKIRLIDFLDVYVPSYLLDYAKLHQDLSFYWSARSLIKIDEVSFKILCKYILEKLDFRLPKIYTDAYDVIQKLNYLRIVPYAKDSATANWLSGVIKELK